MLGGRRHHVAPARGVDDHGLGCRFGLLAEGLGQRTNELAERRLRVLRHGRRRPDDQEQRLHLGERQPAQVGTRIAEKRLPAASSALRVDRDAGRRQRVEVAPGGGDRDLELACDLSGGHEAASLHE